MRILLHKSAMITILEFKHRILGNRMGIVQEEDIEGSWATKVINEWFEV